MEIDPYPERTPCLFDGCNISMEEHHRLSRGYAAELSDLRAKMRQGEETVDLGSIPTRDLLKEIANRIGDD